MVETTKWNGKIYRRYPNSKNISDRRYFQRMGKNRPSRLHRDVWEHTHGPIPEEHHIHHIDGDTSNNDISNLECVSPAEHAKRHAWSDERRERHKKHLDRIRHKTKAWHASPEGIAKHREIGAMAYKNFVPTPKPCEHCEAIFSPKAIGNKDRFCSNSCKSAWRRASGVDDECRRCINCGEQYTCNKYSRKKSCSRACAGSYRSRKGRKSL